MANLYGRVYSLNVNGLLIENLRVSFEVKKNLDKTPNKAELKIYNLGPESRKRLQEKGAPVVLTAGYKENQAVIFSGDLRLGSSERSGADWVTKLTSGDGERAYQWKRFSASYAPGVSIAQVIRDCSRALTLNPGNLESALAKPFRGAVTTFANGYAAHGDAIDILESLLKSAGFGFSIQQGALSVTQAGAPVASPVVLISAGTGMIGSPEINTPEKKGEAPIVKVKSLMQPSIVCGGYVEIQSESIKGQFRAEHVTHTGDTHGSDWYTQVEARAL